MSSFIHIHFPPLFWLTMHSPSLWKASHSNPHPTFSACKVTSCPCHFAWQLSTKKQLYITVMCLYFLEWSSKLFKSKFPKSKSTKLFWFICTHSWKRWFSGKIFVLKAITPELLFFIGKKTSKRKCLLNKNQTFHNFEGILINTLQAM